MFLDISLFVKWNVKLKLFLHHFFSVYPSIIIRYFISHKIYVSPASLKFIGIKICSKQTLSQFLKGQTRVEDWQKRRNCWIKSLFLFSLRTKYSRSFINLRLNHWCHMDYFNNVLTTCLGLECGSCVAVAGSKSSHVMKNIFICVPKMNEGLTGLERHEGE